MNYKALSLTILSMACGLTLSAQHFLTHESYRRQVADDFAKRTAIAADDRAAVMSTEDLPAREALQFLYAYMPQSDIADYSLDFFRQQVHYAFEARNTFSWGKTVPESVFRHFVLVYRVNNEDLDTARAYVFHQLKDRIKDMSMNDAALEVNHWCHEHVDYQPSDSRTSSPLATLRTSHGRCGEESTLAVTAMRAVGIPARQCYTPRWAHCDDNHAWVEVWVDGKWHYLGACEPDPALDMGWFTIPSTRTMMVHTNVFGKYDGPEEINLITDYSSRINLLPNYTETVDLTVKVIDGRRKPLKDATVAFKLYNYSEYYPLAKKTTDEKGTASLTTGKGDLLVWAHKGDAYQYAKVDCRKCDSVTIMLDDKPKLGHCTEQFDIVPPMALPGTPKATPGQQAANARRLQHEDSLRLAYRQTYPAEKDIAGIHNDNFTPEAFFEIIRKSEGNHKEILKFLAAHSAKQEVLLVAEFINALSDKDLRDCQAATLEQQLTEYRPGGYPQDVFVKGILPARIANEMIRPWRKPLREALRKALPQERPTAKDIRELVASQIKVDNAGNYYNCPISPMGVWNGRTADTHSRDIFFVAACRSMDIPAYMDNATGALYAWENGRWNKEAFGAEKPVNDNCTLILHNPGHYNYWSNYSIARFEHGDFVTYDFENDERVLKDPIELHLTDGYYLFSTGNRYPDGKVLSELEFFAIGPGETVERTISPRALTARNDVYGYIDLRGQLIAGKAMQDYILSTGKSKMIVCFVQPGSEPMNHLLNEMARRKAEFESWGGIILFVNAADSWSNKYEQPKNVNVVQNEYGPLYRAFAKGLSREPAGALPLCMVIDLNGNITLVSEGYHIGTGELLLKAVE